MPAWMLARQWQEANCMTAFEDRLGWHLSCGLVHSTPSVFLLARECHWTGEDMVDQQESSLLSLPINAWFVELAAATCHNPIKEFLRVATRPSKFVLWYRMAAGRPHNLHAYRWDHLARKVGLSSPTSSF
jgi:hypothetical protein